MSLGLSYFVSFPCGRCNDFIEDCPNTFNWPDFSTGWPLAWLSQINRVDDAACGLDANVTAAHLLLQVVQYVDTVGDAVTTSQSEHQADSSLF